jgi:lysozyme family protein
MVENTIIDIKEHYRKLDEQMQEVHKIRKDGWNRIKGLIKKKLKIEALTNQNQIQYFLANQMVEKEVGANFRGNLTNLATQR